MCCEELITMFCFLMFSLSPFRFHYFVCIIATMSPILYSLYAYLSLSCRRMGQICLGSSDNLTKSTSLNATVTKMIKPHLLHSDVDVKHSCIYFSFFPHPHFFVIHWLNGLGCTMFTGYSVLMLQTKLFVNYVYDLWRDMQKGRICSVACTNNTPCKMWIKIQWPLCLRWM